MSALGTASGMNHPAAEIVAIALRKIRKVANHKKYVKLTDACKDFLDNIQIIIPPLERGFAGNTGPLPSNQIHSALKEPCGRGQWRGVPECIEACVK